MKWSTKYNSGVILLFIWLVSLFLTWCVVENPYWDFADLLYSSERLSLGQTIYRDFQTPYPPLVFWLYGGVMKIFPHSYAAVCVVSALTALLFLISAYKICRLFHVRSDSLKIAIIIYLAVFTASSVIGENFFVSGFVLVGITLFNWFVWFVAKFLREKPPDLPACLFGGVLAGLCLLSKHERVAGVLGVLAFLAIIFLFWRRNRAYFIAFLVLLLGMLVVGAGGYLYAVIHSGWFYVSSSLMQFGGISNMATHNIPVLTDLYAQVLLIAVHFGFVMAVFTGVMAGRMGDDYNGKLFLAFKCVSGVFFISALLLALESIRVAAVVKQIDFSATIYMTRTMLAVAFLSPHGLQLVQSVVNYFGGILFGSILPVFSTIILLLAVLIASRARQGRWVASPPSMKQLFSALLLCSALFLQARFLFRRSEIGALVMVLPVFFIYTEKLPFMILRLKPKLSFWRVFKRYYLMAFVIVMFLSSFMLYAFESRDVLFRPIVVRSDKGLVRLPDQPMNRAFAQLVSFVRNNNLTSCKVVVVPTSGIQYWIGGRPSPFTWPGPIQPESYRSPWSDNLKEGLEKNDCVFIDFCRQEVNIQSHISAGKWSWIDGPMYRLERWKEMFPLLWNHIQSNTRLAAEFGPTNAPYFRVYVDKHVTLKSEVRSQKSE